jgi:dTDP-4-dehydrorhamnose reductase
VADAAASVGARFVYLSTDYVFDGRSRTPYPVDATPAPLSAYGRSKLAGEEAARRAGRWTVVRTSWVYGGRGGGFLSAVLSRAREGRPLRVVSDERSRPTWVRDLARALLDLVTADVSGIFHAAGGGHATRLELARTALEVAGLDAEVEAVTSRAWGAAAPRPLYSVLDLVTTERVLGWTLPPWDVSLRRHLTGEGSGELGPHGADP